jgi:hypothetical protein
MSTRRHTLKVEENFRPDAKKGLMKEDYPDQRKDSKNS